MHSTFASLETARRALFAQQSALQTTGHNISNANTPGYSRQRVNLNATSPYTAPGMNSPVSAGQVGTGVEAGSVQRVREDFLDEQYRSENSQQGYWQARSDELAKMEEIMNEPSDQGMSKTLDQFWQSLQDLADNPDDEGARAVVRQRGKAVADTFQSIHESLGNAQENSQSQIDAAVGDVNSLARQINHLNERISSVEQHGDLANDLYDQRDLLVDQLSGLADVKVEQVDNGGQSSAMAEGSYTVTIGDGTGGTATLVDGENFEANKITMRESDGGIDHFSVAGKQIQPSGLSGNLQGMTEMVNTDYQDMIDSLDQMANDFVTAFNRVHREGQGLNGETNVDFFRPAADDGSQPGAGNIQVAIGADELDQIAASGNGDVGDGGNAHALAGVITGETTNDTRVKDFQDFYEGKIGGMAVDAAEAHKFADNAATLRESAAQRRESVSGVSLDEEMTNMMKFQHGYNAAARMITVVDENLDRIINQMGVVGR